jgi:transposase InsO family protein
LLAQTVYLAVVSDLHPRKIVDRRLVDTRDAAHRNRMEALTIAIVRQRPPPGLILHSDRGLQYAAEPYRLALARPAIKPSMSGAYLRPLGSISRAFAEAMAA